MFKKFLSIAFHFFLLILLPVIAHANLIVFDEFSMSNGENFRDRGGFYDSVNKQYLLAHKNDKQGVVTYIDEVTKSVSTVNFKGLGEAAGQTNDANWQVGITSFWQDPATGNIRATGFSTNATNQNFKAVYWLDPNTPVVINTPNVVSTFDAILSQSLNGSAVGTSFGVPVYYEPTALNPILLNTGYDSNGLFLNGGATSVSDDGKTIAVNLFTDSNDVPAYFLNQQIKFPDLEGKYIEYGNLNAVSGDGRVIGGTIVTNPDIDPNADYHGVLVSTETNKVIQDFGAGSEVIDVITDPVSGYFTAAINFTDGSTPKLFVEDFGLMLVTDLFPNFTGDRIIDLIPGSVNIVSNTGFVGKLRIEEEVIQIAPEITSHPANAIARLYERVQFSVTATGTDLRYQWKKNNVDIPGATSASGAYTPTTTTDNGAKFKCVVSNDSGTATSNEATLTLDLRPQIESQPQETIVGLNVEASFSIRVTGPNLRYQWKKNGRNIAGATASSYRYTPRSFNEDGITFSCDVSNTYGRVSSNEAKLHVQVAPRITSQTNDVRTTIGRRVTLSVNPYGGKEFNFQWKKNGVAIPGATNQSYTFVVAAGDVDSNYICTVSNLVGRTDSRPIKIIAPPVINPQPQDRTIRRGNSALFSVAAQGGSSLRYQWYRNSSSISGATSSTYQTPVMTSTGTSRYSVKVTNNSATVNSRNAMLRVNNN